jgi:DMSO reductase anchor subunit
MDTGVSYDHYNTTEYNFKDGGGNRNTIRILSLLLLFGAPLVIMMVDYMPLFMGKAAMTAPLAALLMIVGAMMERWLFFVDGNHAQNLYYGNYRVKRAFNPMLQKGIAGAPLPPR